MQATTTHTAPGPKSNRSRSKEGKHSRRVRTPDNDKRQNQLPGKPPRLFFRGTNLLPPGFKPEACVEGTKQAILVDILSRPEGATMEELLQAASGGRRPWIEATVRSAFGWDLKRKGYGVRSEFDAHGVERFHLILPKGRRIPPHSTAEQVRKRKQAMKNR